MQRYRRCDRTLRKLLFRHHGRPNLLDHTGFTKRHAVTNMCVLVFACAFALNISRRRCLQGKSTKEEPYQLHSRAHMAIENHVESRSGLTGAEVSINSLPAGAGVPFVHAHKENEEIYGVLEGAGSVTIDGEDMSLRPATGCAFPRCASSVPRRVRLGDHTSAFRSSRDPTMPSRPTTPSCSNSRLICKGPIPPACPLRNRR